LEDVLSEQRKIRVAVVFGGRGPEHAVSCMGGANVLRSIDRTRYDVVPIGITTEGNWVQVADAPERLAVRDGRLPSVEAVAEPGSEIVPWAGSGGSGLTVADGGAASPAGLVASPAARIPHLFSEVDVVLPVLHGPWGEDGTIQGLLELAGVPYVGAGVLASAVSMDKEYMKLIFAAKGLPIGPFVVVRERDWPVVEGDVRSVEGKRVLDDIADLGWPLFVKPARGGSSLGTSKARDIAELHAAIEVARQYDPKVLVEQAIAGAEVEVSVLQGLDGAAPDTSLPGQILIDGGEDFYDFEAKYLDPSGGIAIPAPIPDSAIAEVRRLAAAAFEAVSGEGLARVDFFYTPQGELILNEINTMPGLSPTSYWQRMWEATGRTFPDLIEQLIQTALTRRPGLR
jgi:D-alanine-D-alanine ligase